MSLIRLLLVSFIIGLATPGAGASPPTADLPAVKALAERIASARGVRVAGTVYVQSTAGPLVPCDWECAFEAPGRYRETLAILGCDDVKTYQYTVCDGTRYMIVDDARREATVGAVLPLARDLRMRVLRDNTIPGQLGLKWGESLFRKAGRESVDGVASDVWDLRTPGAPFRSALWIDPASGLPVRAAQFLALPEQPETLQKDWRTIAIDGSPGDDKMFAIEPPAGYALRNKDQDASDLRTAWSSHTTDPVSKARLDCRFAFAIGDRGAVLLGWSAADARAQETDATRAIRPTLCRFDDDHAPPYRSKVLRRTTLKNGRSLSWIITTPEPGAATSDDRHRWVVVDGRRVGSTVTPLRLERSRLASLMVEIQRAMAAPGDAAVASPLRLEEIEAEATALVTDRNERHR